MSLFGDLDVASAKDNPFEIPNNTYNAFVFDVTSGMSKGREGVAPKFGITIIYKINGGDHDGKRVSEWKHVPRDEDNLSTEDFERAKSYLKARLVSLGVPADRMNQVDKNDLIGTEVTITTKTNEGGFVGVTSVKKAESSVSDFR